MNEQIIKMLFKAMNVNPEDIQVVVTAFVNGQKDIEDIKLLLADSLEVNKQILAELKKRGKK